MPSPRRTASLAALLAGAAILTACSATVPLTAAPDADDPACAEVMVQLPDRLDGQDRRWTDAQSTAAWGDPSAVVFACGVTPPGPTEAQCITAGGMDWIVDDSEAPVYRITSYGRVPAVEVITDNEVVAPTNVLETLGFIAAAKLTRERSCVSSGSVLP